ncbi:hypothetical protein J3R83DRAFT_2346 [Lanmaoa asiatica]|nr:hypothetical protein J3R83DRAFT_2346 [Lanmaoa asiatica]
MPFTEPTAIPSSPVIYSNPSHSDLAAVAATVSVVGVLMAILLTWLILRLRRAAQSQAQSIPIPCRPTSTASYSFRPSFAPSEASSKFGFIRKPLRLSNRHEDGSWDFADPDPFSYSKERPFDPPSPTPSPKQRPTPLATVPAYTPRAHRASTHKDGLVPTHLPPLVPPLPCTLSNHPRQHTVQTPSTSPKSFDPPHPTSHVSAPSPIPLHVIIVHISAHTLFAFVTDSSDMEPDPRQQDAIRRTVYPTSKVHSPIVFPSCSPFFLAP